MQWSNRNIPCLQYCLRASRDPHKALPQKWHMYSECTCKNNKYCIRSDPKSIALYFIVCKYMAKEGGYKYSSKYQWRWRREWRPSLSVISAAFIAFGRSCLLANTSSTASLNSSYKFKHSHYVNKVFEGRWKEKNAKHSEVFVPHSTCGAAHP